MRPPLLVLDFAAGIARRYWPKPDGHGFHTQEARLQKPEGDPWLLGNHAGLALLEDFRKGRLNVQSNNEEEEVA